MAVSEKRHAVPVSGSSDAVEQTDVSVDVPIAKEDETSTSEKKSGSPYLVSIWGKRKTVPDLRFEAFSSFNIS